MINLPPKSNLMFLHQRWGVLHKYHACEQVSLLKFHVVQHLIHLRTCRCHGNSPPALPMGAPRVYTALRFGLSDNIMHHQTPTLEETDPRCL